MLFQSHLCPDIKSPQDLIIFACEEHRVLVPLPQTYEDAQNCVRDLFNVAGEAVLETADLHGSAGTLIRIHGAAWEGIAPILHTVFVKSQVLGAQPLLPTKFPEVVKSPLPRNPTQKKANTSFNVGPSRLASAVAKSPSSASAKNAPAKSSGVRAVFDPSNASFTNVPGKEPARASSLRAAPPEPTPGASPPPDELEPPQASNKEEEEEEEEEEETYIRSPTKKRVHRPRILSEHGMDEAQEEDIDRQVHNRSQSDHEESDELEEAELPDAAPSPRNMLPTTSQALAASKFKPASPSKSGNGSLVALDAVGCARSPKVKVEKSKALGMSDSSSHLQSRSQEIPASQSQGHSDESFLIMIEYEKTDSRFLFKTRGRHMVSKVLMQACRTFDIEKYYDKARLVLLVEDEDEIHRSACKRTATMAEAGAEPNAKFVVEIDDAYEDD
ncbi:hypothetical protein BD414DRAFT_228692 [Trametes punicea]|nr:hypothetical protein BD414DRAFT_228692 [Trametes punicea]